MNFGPVDVFLLIAGGYLAAEICTFLIRKWEALAEILRDPDELHD